MPIPETSEHWLRLNLAPGLGPAGLRTLLDVFGSAAAAANASVSALTAAGVTPEAAAAIAKPDAARLQTALQWLAADDCHLVTTDDTNYPPLLNEVSGAPAVLFVRGDPAALQLPQLAIVGSRNATPGGCELAAAFAAHLCAAGLTVTSGLAEGIDAAAHRAALDAGGTTVAVCGTGLDQVYPAKNLQLANHIAAHGALVSEFAPGTPPARENFPRRNRIISGLCIGTLVVEAGARSGALITARHAVEQGREVFAIPGSVHSPQSKGCHQLIRNGAKLVETATHILEELASLAAVVLRGETTAAASHNAAGETDDRGETSRETNIYREQLDDPARQLLLTAMGWDPVGVDTLVERSGLTAAEVSSMLLIMELEDQVESLSAGQYQRRTNTGKHG